MNNVVLYVEDEENDVILAEIAFKRAQIQHKLVIARDGLQAIEYLAGTAALGGPDANPLPSLVLLDLKLPHKSGFDVLQWIRAQHELRALPVVIYTSSNASSDRDRAKALGASDYCVKPSRISEMTELASAISSRWLTQADPAEVPPGQL